MEKISKEYKLKKSRIYTREQSLCEEIWLWINKKLPFSRIMRIIKEKGITATYMIYNEIKQSNPRNRLSLFIWKVKNEKVEILDNKKETSF